MARLNELAQKIHAHAKAKGFYENPVECGTRLMLIVSELSEALEADRRNHKADLDAFERKVEFSNPDCGISEERRFQAYFETCIKDTFEDEIADAIIRLLDLCAYQGIDIEKHIELKMRYNALRPYKHQKQY